MKGRKKRVDLRAVLKHGGGTAGLVAAVLMVLVTVAAADYLLNAGEIRRGVRVGELSMGGKTPAEARELVESRASAAFESMDFGGREESTLAGEDLGVKVYAASTVEEAYFVGRRGGIWQRLSEVLSSYLGGIRIDAHVGYEDGPAREAMEDLGSRLHQEPRNASLYMDAGQLEVREARDGRALDEEATLANLEEALSDLSGEVPLALKSVEPAVSTREIQAIKPTAALGKYKTDYTWDDDPGREANLRMASEAVDNTLLAPGEVFSFNALAESLEYERARVYAEGGITKAEGGGLCQVSSTLYAAALYADLKILERDPHVTELPYIQPGLDATVWFDGWGEQDFRFKNNTGGYLLIRQWMDDEGGFVRAKIYGRPTGKEVTLRSEKVYDGPRGVKWVTYKKVTKNGKVLSDGVLHEDVYGYL
jgi:vancomycin resistance protein YoaR